MKMFDKIGSEVNISVVFIVETFNPGKPCVFGADLMSEAVRQFISDERCDLIAVIRGGEVVKLNIYIKSGHGFVMKKQLFYLYKWRIVRRLMDAYFIS